MESQIIFNLQTMYDSDCGVIYALSGKLYKLAGTELKKLGFPRSIVETDVVTAKRYKVPDRFSINNLDGDRQNGAIYTSAVRDPSAQLFEEMFKNLENELPPYKIYLMVNVLLQTKCL